MGMFRVKININIVVFKCNLGCNLLNELEKISKAVYIL